MLDVERQKLSTPQADVLRFGAENLQLSNSGQVHRKMLLNCKLAATNFGVNLSPHRKREMKCILQENGCMWKKNQPESVVSDGGRDGC